MIKEFVFDLNEQQIYIWNFKLIINNFKLMF